MLEVVIAGVETFAHSALESTIIPAPNTAASAAKIASEATAAKPGAICQFITLVQKPDGTKAEQFDPIEIKSGDFRISCHLGLI